MRLAGRELDTPALLLRWFPLSCSRNLPRILFLQEMYRLRNLVACRMLVKRLKTINASLTKSE